MFLSDGNVLASSGPAESAAECAQMEKRVREQVRERNRTSSDNPAKGVVTSCAKVRAVPKVL